MYHVRKKFQHGPPLPKRKSPAPPPVSAISVTGPRFSPVSQETQASLSLRRHIQAWPILSGSSPHPSSSPCLHHSLSFLPESVHVLQNRSPIPCLCLKNLPQIYLVSHHTHPKLWLLVGFSLWTFRQDIKYLILQSSVERRPRPSSPGVLWPCNSFLNSPKDSEFFPAPVPWYVPLTLPALQNFQEISSSENFFNMSRLLSFLS